MDKLTWFSAGAHKQLADVLKKDLVVAGPSDTVLGLLAPVSKKGFLALNAIKGRTEKPYLVLVGSKEKASQFVDCGAHPAVIKLMESCWPGPLTLILPKKDHAPDFVGSALSAIAVRVPDHQGMLEILAHMNGLFSTSANKAGEPVPHSLDQLHPDIISQVAVLVDGQSASVQPSTILDCTGDIIVVIREGAYMIDELERIAEVEFVRSTSR